MADNFTLQEGQGIDENLRPVRLNGENTSLEIASDENGAKVKGDLEVTGDLKCAIDKIVSTGGAGLEIQSDLGIKLNSYTGRFNMQSDGTTFSVNNSAFAGMILGYRCIGEDATPVTYTLTTSMVTIHSQANVSFIAPPSGNVEIMFQAHYYGGNGATVTLGISDNAVYSALSAPSAQYEKVSFDVSRFDDAILNQNWVITGLTAGDSYQYWIGAKTSSTLGTPTIKYGGDSAGENVPLIIKVTALPFAAADYAEYG